MKKPSSNMKPTPTTLNAPHGQVVAAIASCFWATVNAMKKDTKKAAAKERACYSNLFQHLFGRKPTKDELDYMTGNDPSLKQCERCRQMQRVKFLPDGTCEFCCGCTDTLDNAFGREENDDAPSGEAAAAWERLKRGEEVVLSTETLDALAEHFRVLDGDDADLFFREVGCVANPRRLGVRDEWLVFVKALLTPARVAELERLGRP